MTFSFGRAARPVLIGAVTALLVAACSSTSSTPSGGATTGSTQKSAGLEKPTITVGVLPVIDDAPLEIAIKNGYFTQQGLTVKTTPLVQSTAAVPALLHGTVDIIGGGNYTSYIEGNAKGTYNISIVGMATNCTEKNFEVLTLPGSGITSAKDLAGKTVAVNLTNNIQTLTLNAILKSEGVSGTPTYIAIPFPNMAAALKAHRVAAVSVVEPFITATQKADGAVAVTSECTGPVANYPLSGYFATGSWVQQNPNTLKAFQKAMTQAQTYANANPAAVRAILPTYTKITAAAAQHVAIGTFPPSIDVTQLQALADLMTQQGMISGSFQVSKIVAP
jgi:NitT/TauT family transport system substrate-binding protein